MMIGARTAAWAKSGYTAKDYVQDGLIAMWDGIENAGWGQHNPNSTVWKDLVSGDYDFLLNAGKTLDFRNEGIDFDGGETNYDVAEIKNEIMVDGECTVEFVGLIRGTKYGVPFCFNSNGFRIATSPENDYRGFSFKGGRLTSVKNNIVHHENANVSCVLYTSKSVKNTYLNGRYLGENGDIISYETTKSGMIKIAYGNGVFNGVINCVRIYNRSLEQTEIAANYAIDKARFNLP